MTATAARGPTPEQIAYLRDLSERAGRPYTEPRSAAQARVRIEILQARIAMRPAVKRSQPTVAVRKPTRPLPPAPLDHGSLYAQTTRALKAVKNYAYRLSDAHEEGASTTRLRKLSAQLDAAEVAVDRLMAEWERRGSTT